MTAERIPYQKSQPRNMRSDVVISDAMGDQNFGLWVPLSDHILFRPLQFNVSAGQYTHIMRVTRSGEIARHRHSGPVHAWVLKGSCIFEPPGETHTLTVPFDCTEMVTLFQVTGSLLC